MSKHQRFIQFALQIANKSRRDQRYRVGCVLVKKGVPVGLGFNNMKKTHPRAKGYKYPYLHAELSSMIGVDAEKINGAIAYVARVKKTGQTGIAKPCCCCEEELSQNGVKAVYYTTETGEIGYMKL